jgi:hypothetical protein
VCIRSAGISATTLAVERTLELLDAHNTVQLLANGLQAWIAVRVDIALAVASAGAIVCAAMTLHQFQQTISATSVIDSSTQHAHVSYRLGISVVLTLLLRWTVCYSTTLCSAAMKVSKLMCATSFSYCHM